MASLQPEMLRSHSLRAFLFLATANACSALLGECGHYSIYNEDGYIKAQRMRPEF